MSAAYLRSTRAAAAAIPGAGVVSLAGGCHGVAVPVDGATLVLARDPELGSGPGSGTWGAWLVDQDGEHASPTVDVGFIRPRDYAAPMVTAALAAIREEMTRR